MHAQETSGHVRVSVKYCQLDEGDNKMQSIINELSQTHLMYVDFRVYYYSHIHV